MKIEYKEKSDVYVQTLPISKVHKISDTHVQIYYDRADIELIVDSHQTTVMFENVDSDLKSLKERDCF